MGISLKDAKNILDSIQDIGDNKENLLVVLPKYHTGYDIYEVSNLLLQLSFNGMHYHEFIKSNLNKEEIFKSFNLSVEPRGVKLEHKNKPPHIFNSPDTILKISYSDMTYDSSYLEYKKNDYKKYCVEKGEIEGKVIRVGYRENLTRAIMDYVENPSIKSRLNIFNKSLKKENKTLHNLVFSIKNMTASETVFKTIYENEIKQIELDKRSKELKERRQREMKEWIENEFPEVQKDVENVILHLRGLGYSYRKDI